MNDTANDSAFRSISGDGFSALRELEKSLTTIRSGLADIAVIGSPVVQAQAREVMASIDAFAPCVAVVGVAGVGKSSVLSAIAGVPGLFPRDTDLVSACEEHPGQWPETIVPRLLRLRDTPHFTARGPSLALSEGMVPARLCLVVLSSGEAPSGDEAELLRRLHAIHAASTLIFVNARAGGAASLAGLKGWLAQEGIDGFAPLAGNAATGDGIPALRAAISEYFATAEGRLLRETVLARTKRILALMEGQQPVLRAVPSEASDAPRADAPHADVSAEIRAIRSAAAEAAEAAFARLRLELDLRIDRRRAQFEAACRARLEAWVNERGLTEDWACTTTELRLHLRASYLWYAKEVGRALGQIADQTAERSRALYATLLGAEAVSLPVPAYEPARIELTFGLDHPLTNKGIASRRSRFPFMGRSASEAPSIETRIVALSQSISDLVGGIRVSVEPPFDEASRAALRRFTGECCRLLTEQSGHPAVLVLRA